MFALGETGVNPVRARRRVVRFTFFLILSRNQNERAIEYTLEKVEKCALSRNIQAKNHF